MFKPGRVYQWAAVAGLLILAWPPAGLRAAVEDYFASGVEAARQQDHAAAVRYFEAAARGGMRSPVLYYNLGVSYYHEGRLDKAEQAFQQAAQSSKLEALSYYNLGLIAREQGQREQALTRFRQAEAAAQSEQLRNLSVLAQRQMTGEREPAAALPAPWFVWVEGGLAYDSNATLAADFETRTGGSDETWRFSAYGHYQFTHWRVHGLIDVERYSELSDFHYDLLETGISLPLESGDWEFRPGLSLRRMRVGNEPVQDSALLLLESDARAGDFGLEFYLEHESVTGGAGYEYLDGTRSYMQANLITPSEHWRLVWDTELNEREDLSFADGEFFSFSPRRRQWRLEYSDSLTDRLDWTLAAGWQDSVYDDPDIRVDENGATTAVMRRKDDRKRLSLELEYAHWEHWRSRLELIYSERDSNFDEFDYDRDVFAFSMGRGFGQ